MADATSVNVLDHVCATPRDSGKERPKVAIVSTHVIQYHAPWFRALASRGDLDPVVLYCREAGPQDQAKAGFGVEFNWDVSLLEGYRWEYLRNIAAKSGFGFWDLDTPDLSRRILQLEFDAVVVNGWHYKSAWQAMLAGWRAGIPVLARSDSHLGTPRHPSKSRFKWPLYRAFVPRLDGCLPVGTASRQYFLRYGARPDRIFEVPHATDSTRFTAEARMWSGRAGELRKKWGLPQDGVVFLFAGKFSAQKRPLDFVHAIATARRMGADVAGLMVGDGELREACEAEARNSGAPVSFTGFLNQAQIVSAYVAADALVLPSHSETWGLVVNEAMVCGKPAFVSDRVGCATDLVDPSKTGDVYPTGNVTLLAHLMATYADRQKLRAMGENARRKIAAHSPENAAERLAFAVRATVERKQRATRQS